MAISNQSHRCLDFTVIPRCVQKTLETSGCPLTDEQFMLMCGALAAAQQMIEQLGLGDAIEILQPMVIKELDG